MKPEFQLRLLQLLDGQWSSMKIYLQETLK